MFLHQSLRNAVLRSPPSEKRAGGGESGSGAHSEFLSAHSPVTTTTTSLVQPCEDKSVDTVHLLFWGLDHLQDMAITVAHPRRETQSDGLGMWTKGERRCRWEKEESRLEGDRGGERRGGLQAKWRRPWGADCGMEEEGPGA